MKTAIIQEPGVVRMEDAPLAYEKIDARKEFKVVFAFEENR